MLTLAQCVTISSNSLLLFFSCKIRYICCKWMSSRSNRIPIPSWWMVALHSCDVSDKTLSR
jgi:hypothetical protein